MNNQENYAIHRSSIRVEPNTEITISLEQNLYGNNVPYLVIEEHIKSTWADSFGQAILKEKPKPKSITHQCSVELRKSKHSAGYYVALKHNGKDVVILGLDDKSAHLKTGSSKYNIKKADGATVSFNIFEER